MRVGLASDHAGFDYKRMLAGLLESLGHEVVDFGCDGPESCDYPDYVRPAAEALARGEIDRAIVLGGSGNGEAIVANRVPGVRCALAWSPWSARMGRAHNDANCLSLGQRTVGEDEARELVRIFLDTPFDGGRHARRVEKIDPKGGAPHRPA